ncbi:MAG: glycoside hydrolase 5 family protein, partial [Planctomycetota bacterium]
MAQIDSNDLCNPDKLPADYIDLLVLPNANILPAQSMTVIESFAQYGGNIIALKTPMFQQPMLNLQGQWATRKEFRLRRGHVLPEHVFLDFTPDDIVGWEREGNDLDKPITYETVAQGPAPNSRSLHVIIPDHTNYDAIGATDLDNPFADRHTLTVFSAKGGPRTNQLRLEWRETDESRWVAVVPLTQMWQQYVLKPENFHYWGGKNRRDTYFQPHRAKELYWGLAHFHTGPIGGRHEFWVGPVGSAKMTPEFEKYLQGFQIPVLDTLSPDYMLFDTRGVSTLKTPKNQFILNQNDYSAPSLIRSPHPRPSGAGFDKDRAFRWIPLIEAYSTDGQWRGTPATLLAHPEGQYKGGIWASFGIQDNNWYKSTNVLNDIRKIAQWMKKGTFILDGGTNYYTYFQDQEIKLGIRAANLGKETQKQLTATVKLIDAQNSNKLFEKNWTLSLQPGQIKTLYAAWKPTTSPKAGFHVTAELQHADKTIDRLTHQVHVWKPKKEKKYITIENGDFLLDGKPWRAHGVNYMPSSGIAMPDKEMFDRWLSAPAYDPDIIERDLANIKDLGFNAVSIFIFHENIQSQNLLDILRQLEELDIKVNLSLRPGTPMHFNFSTRREIIEYYKLTEFDIIFAYDLAWEPLFHHSSRYRLNREWEKWIVERYGSITNAQRDWDYPIDTNDRGHLAGPDDKQFSKDGDWRRMTAAYRRFLDTLLYKKYGAARRLIKSIDPYHHVSFRMTEAGDPTFNWENCIPYDYPYLAAAVDFFAPETYGRIGDWERVKPGWFQFEYARWANPQIPMIWSEAGVSAWDRSERKNTDKRLRFQADFYRDLYRMMIESTADGVFFWWYPGGVRFNESSDYGVINPDGTDRLVTKVIREMGPRFINAPPTKPVDHWIEFDRDAHAEGLPGEYQRIKDEYWNMINAGRIPGLKTAGTNTNSANCPLLAVGNTPCNGTNPPKYLDAAFDLVEIQDPQGNWLPVKKSDRVNIDPQKPVIATIELTNLGEAEWLSPTDNQPGGVYITIQGSDSPPKII